MPIAPSAAVTGADRAVPKAKAKEAQAKDRDRTAAIIRVRHLKISNYHPKSGAERNDTAE